MIIQKYLKLVKRLLILMCFYSLLRLGFYFYHAHLYEGFDFIDVSKSFLLGLRFDVASICLLNIPTILLSLISSKNKKFEIFDRIIFVFINSVAIFVSVNDFELFNFMGKRLSLDLFAISDDIWAQVPQLAVYYWYFPLIGIFFAISFYYLDKKLFSFEGKFKKSSGVFLEALIGVTVIFFAVIGIRGGLQNKSINIQSAFSQGKNELGHLVLNSPYHFLRTFRNQKVDRLKYFGSEDELKKIIMARRNFETSKVQRPQSNVVLIILESFSLEYMEEGFMPFLSELKKSSLFFERHLANGKRSIEALPSLLCGLPALLDVPISKSSFQGNRFNCMPKILKESGYTNYFFHGGARGTMGFDSYTLANGFDRYFGKEDYPDQSQFDGTWGIYDGPYLDYFAKTLKTIPRPFLASIFTLSSHQPYSIPLKFKNKFPKGTLEIHESIGYVDHALKNFFEAIKTEPWFNNTLFVITADHAQKLHSSKFENIIGRYRVPLLFYYPGIEWKGINTKKVTHHSDIPDSILDFLGEERKLPITGESVFSESEGMALNYADGSTYYFIKDRYLITMNKDSSQFSMTYDWETGKISEKVPSNDSTLKAYLQYFINGLVTNNLSNYR